MELNKKLNSCPTIIPTTGKWKHKNLKPKPPQLRGLIKIHKPDTLICPIINWKTAPGYKIAKLVSDIIKYETPLPNTLNLQNSSQLMDELQQIPYGPNIRLASFDIKNMYTNVPTSTLPHILNLICTHHNKPTTFTHDLTQLVHMIIKQNYFNFHDSIYIQNQGLAMGAPTSSVFSEMFIQFTEHTAIIDILTHNQILGSFRYIDDVLLVYDTTLTDIHTVLDSFNKATAPLQFTIEEKSQKKINYLDITIYRDVHQFTYGIYRKPTATDNIIPSTSCHPLEHKHSAIRFLQNHLQTYPISEQSRKQEEQIIAHILHSNSYPLIKLNTYNRKQKTNNSSKSIQQTKTKWAKFTFTGKETRFITKILKKPVCASLTPPKTPLANF
jgi:hypothetical protein